ncbi:hypothetical protein NUW58_g6980 [Xylaria curta]|uniref:Uncharacterized protein n=1 Tax=Xylaria curta TaxID=42375 RepID=A0ACC1NLY0_9PEZI|nr:hypothetical protein NUW58_g6980 [Xylaria curta]
MFPLEALNLGLCHTLQFRLDISPAPPVIVPFHPQHLNDRGNKNEAGRRKVETVADLVIRGVEWEIRPCGDEAANVAEHNVRANSYASASKQLVAVRKAAAYRTRGS